MSKVVLLLVIPFLVCLAVACSGDDDDPSPTATIPAAVTNTPPAAGSETSTPAATTPVATGTVPPTDGTVFPQNPGSTDPFTFKAMPDPLNMPATLVDVRVGAHPEQGGWDRIVFEFENVRPSGLVEYRSSVAGCGSGMPVTVPGQAILFVRFEFADAHNEQGQLTIDSTEVNGPGNSIVKAVSTCDFEAIVEWAIGTTAMKNFKVALLENPTRVVIDVKW